MSFARLKSIGHYRAWVVVAVSFLIVALASIVVAELDARVERETDLARMVDSISSEMNHQSALEWEAIARGEISDEIAAETRQLRNSTLHGLRERADGGDPEWAKLASLAGTYYAAVTTEFDFLDRGRVDAAEEVDEARVDPAFDEFTTALDEVSVLKREHAGEIDRVALVGTIVSLLLSAGLVSIVFWRFHRFRRRQAVEAGQHDALESSERRFRALIEEASETITVVDADGLIRFQVGALDDLLGRDVEAVSGSPFADLLHPDDRDLFTPLLEADAGASRIALEWRLRHADGHYVASETIVADLRGDDRVDGLVLTTRDIGDQKALEEQLRHRAFHDPLTQLANRALFLDRVEHALARESRQQERSAVFFIDLDDFKTFNDTYGHAGGDELLIRAAARLRSAVRSADTVARLGGDEFGVLVESVSGAGEAAQAAKRILAAYDEPIVIHGQAVNISASVGVAISALESTDAEGLLRDADIAMYTAKRSGKARYELRESSTEVVEDMPAMDETADKAERTRWFMRGEDSREEIESLLADPLSIVSVFQPLVELATGHVSGYEALARFSLDQNRPPNAWFAQAHRAGLGPELEAKALAAAFAAPDRPEGTYLSVNLSPSALSSHAVDVVLPKDLSNLIIEITENELIGEGAELAGEMASLRRRGARIAVDDAGSGYASLRQLTQLAPDVIKLDRALIDGVSADPAKIALVESLVLFASRIGATVCAEGIETIEDLTALADLDVTYGQGYVLARPAPPWAEVDPGAATALATSSTRSMSDQPGAVGYPVHRQLERVAATLAEATDVAGLERALSAVATSLNADEVRLHSVDDAGGLETVAVHPRDVRSSNARRGATTAEAIERVLDDQTPRQLILSSNDDQGRCESLLLVPVVLGGRSAALLEACSHEPRTWARLEIIRARIFGFELGTVLENLRSRAARVPRRTATPHERRPGDLGAPRTLVP